MFTNKDILKIAMQQSANDINCIADDFLKNENIIVESNITALAKKYYEEPISCNFVSYGNNIVASVKPEYKKIIEQYINRFEFFHCFETPNIHWLDKKLSVLGQRVCFMSEYYLPDLENLRRLSCDYQMKILHQEDFSNLYTKEWANALCKERKELDVLGIGAYDGTQLVGLAGCSADCDDMWQIGVDVLPAYRQKGIACALTSNLAMEILKNGKVPFYCSAWSNIRSVRNAVKSGFIPAWVELTIKPADFVDELNSFKAL